MTWREERDRETLGTIKEIEWKLEERGERSIIVSCVRKCVHPLKSAFYAYATHLLELEMHKELEKTPVKPPSVVDRYKIHKGTS